MKEICRFAVVDTLFGPRIKIRNGYVLLFLWWGQVMLVVRVMLSGWSPMQEQLGLLKGQPLSVHQMEEVLKVLADLEGFYPERDSLVSPAVFIVHVDHVESFWIVLMVRAWFRCPHFDVLRAGSDDQNLKQASDHSCSTQTSVASMGASLPCSESDAEEPNVHPRRDNVRPTFQAKSISKRLEIQDRLYARYARVTRRYSQSRDLTIRVARAPSWGHATMILPSAIVCSHAHTHTTCQV